MKMTQKIIDLSHIPKFDGTYFHIWKHRLTLFFKTKKVWLSLQVQKSNPITPTTTEIVDGSETFPTTSASSVSSWEYRDIMSLSIINNFLNNNIV